MASALGFQVSPGAGKSSFHARRYQKSQIGPSRHRFLDHILNSHGLQTIFEKQKGWYQNVHPPPPPLFAVEEMSKVVYLV